MHPTSLKIFSPLQQLQPPQSFLPHLDTSHIPLLVTGGGLLRHRACWPASARGTSLRRAADSTEHKETRRISGFSSLQHLVNASKSCCWRRQGSHETHFPGKPGWKEQENEPHSKGASSMTPLPCKLDIWMSHLPSVGKLPDLSLGKQKTLNV